jgi:hypothetical protein
MLQRFQHLLIPGVVSIDMFEDPSFQAIEGLFPSVAQGGRWDPPDCQAHRKVAVIIPYRDREHHLRLMLKRLHAMLPKQKLSYQIFVVEQVRFLEW